MISVPSHRAPAFTPTMITTYQRCPMQYRHRYVDRKFEEGFNAALARGNAAHAVLRDAFVEYQRSQSFPRNLRERIEANLPRDAYLEQRAWEEDVETVLDWVKSPLRDFDGNAEIVAVERTLEYVFPGNNAYPAFRLRARVDLVLEHPDGTLEHLDWKTSSGHYVDSIQQVASRIVVAQSYPKRSVVRSSTAFLPSESTRTEVLSREYAKTIWHEIKEVVATILSESDYQPFPNPLCEYCPMFGRECPIYPPTEEGTEIADWLDEKAA